MAGLCSVHSLLEFCPVSRLCSLRNLEGVAVSAQVCIDIELNTL